MSSSTERDKERQRFIWIYGVAGFGLSVGGLGAVAFHRTEYEFGDDAFFSVRLLVRVLIFVVVGACFGYGFGARMWSELRDRR